jgi:hypothetical protein
MTDNERLARLLHDGYRHYRRVKGGITDATPWNKLSRGQRDFYRIVAEWMLPLVKNFGRRKRSEKQQPLGAKS